MPARVTLLGPLRDLAQVGSLATQAPSVEVLLEELEEQFGDEFADRARRARILVNGAAIQFGRGEHTLLRDGDDVALVFPVGGG